MDGIHPDDLMCFFVFLPSVNCAMCGEVFSSFFGARSKSVSLCYCCQTYLRVSLPYQYDMVQLLILAGLPVKPVRVTGSHRYYTLFLKQPNLQSNAEKVDKRVHLFEVLNGLYSHNNKHLFQLGSCKFKVVVKIALPNLTPSKYI